MIPQKAERAEPKTGFQLVFAFLVEYPHMKFFPPAYTAILNTLTAIWSFSLCSSEIEAFIGASSGGGSPLSRLQEIKIIKGRGFQGRGALHCLVARSSLSWARKEAGGRASMKLSLESHQMEMI